MITSNGLTTTNGGRLVTCGDFQVEVLCKSISGHKANIVVYYMMEGRTKTSVSYYEDEGRKGHEIYKFDSPYSLQHYWSRNYSEEKLPAKYRTIAYKLKTMHEAIFKKGMYI